MQNNMTLTKLKNLLAGIEWTDVEFKEAGQGLPKSIWDTVCAFANTEGGYVVLGIAELNGKYSVSGVENPDKMQNDFLTTLRGEKFNIQLSSKGHVFTIEGKRVLAFKISSIRGRATAIR